MESAFKYIWSWEMERVHSYILPNKKKSEFHNRLEPWNEIELAYICINTSGFKNKDLSVDVDPFKLRCFR